MTVTMLDTVRRIVREEIARRHMTELAIVTDTHPHAADSDSDNYACSVRLRDGQIELKRVPVVTHRHGAASLPTVGEVVLVEFVGGSIDQPIIVGSLYNNVDRPPLNGDGKAVLHLPLGAADSDAAHIEVSTDGTRILQINMGTTKVTIQDDDPAVTIDVGGNGKVEIGSNGAIKFQSSGNIDLKADGNVTVQASGDLTLKGATVKIN